MELFMLALAVAVFGFIAYQFGIMRSKSRKPAASSKGKVIVVDRSKPDTSKEDELDERFKDALKDKDLK